MVVSVRSAHTRFNTFDPSLLLQSVCEAHVEPNEDNNNNA